MAKLKLTVELVRRCLNYDPVTGIFTWKLRVARRIRIGDVAGSVDQFNGYIVIGLGNKVYKAHRLAWIYMTGEVPDHEVDHKNGEGLDNRWKNLRRASDAENAQNAKLRTDNTSGIKGVHWHKATSKWAAHISVNKRAKHLGLFETVQLAQEFRQLVADMCHGEFVNHGAST